uniref:Centriolar satellite-associated tubulin polyglutamylase complex regulator 1 n=1 Tax=Eptatretus burgeri TaxID=7764 RepID=A0A8C4NJV5_EPTBU
MDTFSQRSSFPRPVFIHLVPQSFRITSFILHTSFNHSSHFSFTSPQPSVPYSLRRSSIARPSLIPPCWSPFIYLLTSHPVDPDGRGHGLHDDAGVSRSTRTRALLVRRRSAVRVPTKRTAEPSCSGFPRSLPIDIILETFLQPPKCFPYFPKCKPSLLHHSTNHCFHDVCTRTHVLFREYSFVSATAYNRASFLHNFWKCYKNILKEMEFLSTWDLHSLVQLLCTDFPRHLVLDAARITFPGQVNDYLVPFADFLYAFQLQFYFNEFLQVVAKIYERSARGGKPCRTDEQCQLGARSITPASENASWMEQQQVGFSATEPESPVMSGANEGPCGILGGHLLQQLLNLDNHHISCPPGSVLHDILSKIDRITFDNFLITLSKHDGINNHIGVLPNKLLVRSISTAS